MLTIHWRDPEGRSEQYISVLNIKLMPAEYPVAIHAIKAGGSGDWDCRLGKGKVTIFLNTNIIGQYDLGSV